MHSSDEPPSCSSLASPHELNCLCLHSPRCSPRPQFPKVAVIWSSFPLICYVPSTILLVSGVLVNLCGGPNNQPVCHRDHPTTVKARTFWIWCPVKRVVTHFLGPLERGRKWSQHVERVQNLSLMSIIFLPQSPSIFPTQPGAIHQPGVRLSREPGTYRFMIRKCPASEKGNTLFSSWSHICFVTEL